MVNIFDRLSTNDDGEGPTPRPSGSNINVIVPNDNSRRKRGPEGSPGNNPPKKGRPNIPKNIEEYYKKARNSRVRAARYLANETMLKKYLDHGEHIAPANMRMRTTPPFGGEDPQVRRQWREIQIGAEKAMLSCQIEFLRTQASQEEANAELYLSQLRANSGNDEEPYEEAQAASATVASRVRGAEIQKLRHRWVHDVQRQEAEKVGLSTSFKGRGKGKKSLPGKGVPKGVPEKQARKTLKGKRRNPESSNNREQGRDETPPPPRGKQGRQAKCGPCPTETTLGPPKQADLTI